ncbi:F-actin-capping protein subunit alpha [Fimicolochytrium jonesii]|uniref:F-actin-capping protein subunit alpha n=1 Tax=Fimicolochytrium jonesii TaxID=1396493 RepID=UPI0022FDBC7D|nr:F-actin-capping protein subunit alpha [Fimicolochytrium jonesii]KAI8823584.1 F-actin-capping protein subunit alpha [Fimicolochytrium jonesii]
MSELSDEAKLQIVGGFLKESPPGEINDVFNDVRVLLEDEALLENGVTSCFQEYNLEQFATVVPPGQQHQVILSKYGQLDGERFVDPRSGTSFVVDHIRHTASDAQPADSHGSSEPYRQALDTASIAYIEDHYPDGTATVYGGEQLVLAIVDNKYNPNNFWNGRWRSVWITQPGATEVTGSLKVNVHYYEDGNVQLTANKDITFSVTDSGDPQAFAKAVIKQIAKAESDFQVALSEKFAEMSESIFKALRRALPITRSKINWDSIATYKVGSEISSK